MCGVDPVISYDSVVYSSVQQVVVHRRIMIRELTCCALTTALGTEPFRTHPSFPAQSFTTKKQLNTEFPNLILVTCLEYCVHSLLTTYFVQYFESTPPPRRGDSTGRQFRIRVTDANDDDYLMCSPPIEVASEEEEEEEEELTPCLAENVPVTSDDETARNDDGTECEWIGSSSSSSGDIDAVEDVIGKSATGA